ncbi:MAG: hypothetical protein M9952_11700 [Microthrixaceae bacterium]|nr:hypothetical protein [Microthrixaceae bacterium]
MSATSTNVALYRTLLSATTSRARVYGFVGVAVVQLIVSWMVRGSGDRVQGALTMIDAFGLTLTIPLAALVFGTASLGDPIEDGTYVYLWLRPLRRAAISAAAFASTLTLVVPLAVLPTVLSALVIAEGPRLVLAAAVASMAAAVAYSAVFVLIGQLTRRSLVWGIAYLLIFEQFIARGGRGVGFLSLHSYAVALVQSISHQEMRLAYFGGVTAAVVLATVTVAMLAISMRRQRSMTVA